MQENYFNDNIFEPKFFALFALSIWFVGLSKFLWNDKVSVTV